MRRPRSSTRVVDRNEEATAEPGGGRGERRRSERAARSAGSKGSYYNKFVGGLRSGNNSELRATLRMCLSLLLFKWKWKATSCNGRDLYLCPSLFSRPPLYLYGVLSFEFCWCSLVFSEVANRGVSIV